MAINIASMFGSKVNAAVLIEQEGLAETLGNYILKQFEAGATAITLTQGTAPEKQEVENKDFASLQREFGEPDVFGD